MQVKNKRAGLSLLLRVILNCAGVSLFGFGNNFFSLIESTLGADLMRLLWGMTLRTGSKLGRFHLLLGPTIADIGLRPSVLRNSHAKHLLWKTLKQLKISKVFAEPAVWDPDLQTGSHIPEHCDPGRKLYITLYNPPGKAH